LTFFGSTKRDLLQKIKIKKANFQKNKILKSKKSFF